MGLLSRPLGRATRLVRTVAARRGVFGDSGPWLAVFVLFSGARVLRRLLGDRPHVVYRQALRPGDRILVSHPEAPAAARR